MTLDYPEDYWFLRTLVRAGCDYKKPRRDIDMLIDTFSLTKINSFRTADWKANQQGRYDYALEVSSQKCRDIIKGSIGMKFGIVQGRLTPARNCKPFRRIGRRSFGRQVF